MKKLVSFIFLFLLTVALNANNEKPLRCDSGEIEHIAKKLTGSMIDYKWDKRLGISHIKLHKKPSQIARKPDLLCKVPIEFRVVSGIVYQVFTVDVFVKIIISSEKKGTAKATYKEIKLMKEGNILTDEFGEDYE
ncbi:MAG: hypothetical protein AB7E49_11420 [Campylobacterales bacterium]